MGDEEVTMEEDHHHYTHETPTDYGDEEKPAKKAPTPVVTGPQPINDQIVIIHLICIFITAISFVFIFAEIISMILLLIAYKQLYAAEADYNRYILTMVTIAVACITFAYIVVWGVLSFGVGLVFLVFCIPYVVSGVLLFRLYTKVRGEYTPPTTV